MCKGTWTAKKNVAVTRIYHKTVRLSPDGIRGVAGTILGVRANRLFGTLGVCGMTSGVSGTAQVVMVAVLPADRAVRLCRPGVEIDDAVPMQVSG